MNHSKTEASSAAGDRSIRPGTTIVSLLYPPRGIGEVVTSHLSVYFGPRTTAAAVEDIAKRTFGRDTASLERRDVPMLLGALRPLLVTLLGSKRGEVVRRRIEREALY